MGGPIQKDKTFLFMNYEGFRQALDETSVALVPDANSRAEANLLDPIVSQIQLDEPVAGAPPSGSQGLGTCPALSDTPVFTDSRGIADGIQNYCSSPLQTIREDFGTTRLDHKFSER